VTDKLTILTAYKIAIETRNFEIELYWKRSLFFWGFIATAFIGYGSLIVGKQPNLAFAVACFGVICSLCWTLVNRGSKYWQEHWEAKVTDFECKLGDIDLFRAEDKLDDTKSKWLGAKKFSVSRISIALSDFTLVVWSGLVIERLLNLLFSDIELSTELKIYTLSSIIFLYVFLILRECKSKPWIPHVKSD
jgi:hypothetical protein